MARQDHFLPTVIVNKPYGVLSCFTDPLGRPTLASWIPLLEVYPAGRLDAASEGLLLLTANGALAHRVTDPRYKLPKTYLVQVDRIPSESSLQAIRTGILVKGQRTKPARVTLLPGEPRLWPRSVPIRFRKAVPTAWLCMTLWEGRNRQIRHMTAVIGHPTLRLVRIAIGAVALGSLLPGQWRYVTAAEEEALWTGSTKPLQGLRPSLG